MPSLLQTAAKVWRDFTINGVGSSPVWWPAKTDIRTWGTGIESAIDAVTLITGAAAVKGTKAQLNAVAGSFAEGDIGVVINDPTAANNGVYELLSGAWFFQYGLPYALAATAAAEAAESAGLAADSAATAAVVAASLIGTSATSLVIGTGTKVFTTQAGKQFPVGAFLMSWSDADPTNFMVGRVVSYSGTTLTLNVTSTGGTGTHSDWTIQVSGPVGQRGVTGATGSAISNMYETVADVAAANMGSTVFVWVAGYAAAGDGGDQLMVAVGSEPAHAFKIQSNDGVWFEAAENELWPAMVGGFDQSVLADATDQIQQLFDAMMLKQRAGALLGATYGVRPGVLRWTPPLATDQVPGPVLRTIEGVTKFLAVGSANLPFLQISNDPATTTPVVVTGTFTSASAVVTGIADTSAITVGAPVDSSKVPAFQADGDRTYVLSKTSTTITLSQAANASGSATIAVHDVGEGSVAIITGGNLGAIIFQDTQTDIAPLRCGILLSGIQNMRMGLFEGKQLRGDVCRIWNRSLNHVVGGIGDIYDVGNCDFDGFYQTSHGAGGSNGWALNNEMPGQGFFANKIGVILSNNSNAGAWKGPGSGNRCLSLTAGYCLGYGIYWDGNGSTVRANQIDVAEIDACQYGLFLNRVSDSSISLRFDHRYHEVVGSEHDLTAWPKVAMQVGSDGGGNVQITCIHRLQTDVDTLAKLGVLLDLNNNTNFTQLIVKQDIQDQVGIGITRDKLVINGPSQAAQTGSVVYWKDEIVYDCRRSHRVEVAMASGAHIGSSGWASAAALPYTVVIRDDFNCFDVASSTWTCPYSGDWFVEASMLLNIAAGTQGRMGVLVVDESTSPATIGVPHVSYKNASGGAKESWQLIPRAFALTKGQKIRIAGTCGTGATVDDDVATRSGNMMAIWPAIRQ